MLCVDYLTINFYTEAGLRIALGFVFDVEEVGGDLRESSSIRDTLRLYELLDRSMVVNLKTKNERIVKIAFVSECCRVKRDKYFSSVELPACKRVKMRGNL